MKRLSYFLATFLLFITICGVRVEAKNEITNDPYDTFIIGLDGEYVSSSMAYDGINVLNLGFNSPEDIFIGSNDDIYVADKGNKVIYRYNQEARLITKIGEGILEGPTGVCVGDDGTIYVADYEGKLLYSFNQNGELIRKYDRPTEPLFGRDSIYKPTKVSVDKIGNIYITSEGNANGVIQMNTRGEFIGYFGPNTINVTLSLLIKRLFLSKEDKETYASLTPKPTTNIAIDSKNIVHTIVEGAQSEGLKKFNVNGTNLLSPDSKYSKSFKDIAVDDNGFIYTVSNDKKGTITVRDKNANVLFAFGNTTSGSMSMGHFDGATGIDVDSRGNIWVLDGVGKNIQVFTKTHFTKRVIDAMLYYDMGEYDKAKEAYLEIVSQNSSFLEAYIGLGNIAQRNQEYAKARDYFKIANYKTGYSDAFWELRDDWISSNLLWIVIVVLVLIVLHLLKIKSLIFAKAGIDLEPTKKKIREFSYVQEFKYFPHMLKNPSDTMYDVKMAQKIRIRTALIFYVLFIVINISCDLAITGYLFRPTMGNDINLAFEILKWGLIIPIIAIANHLVSSLQKGEGFFRDIFIGLLLAFAPVFIFKLPLSILSNVLTYNEAFIFDLFTKVIWIWSIINVFIVIKYVHNYTIGELIVNVILTILAVIIIIFIYLMIYILCMQFFQFIIGLIREALLR